MANDKDKPTVRSALAQMEHDPWLPIETKLVVGSLVTGVVLLVILLFVTLP